MLNWRRIEFHKGNARKCTTRTYTCDTDDSYSLPENERQTTTECTIAQFKKKILLSCEHEFYILFSRDGEEQEINIRRMPKEW